MGSGSRRVRKRDRDDDPDGFAASVGQATRDQRYQDSYYDLNRDDLSTKARRRWESNERGYRDRGLARAQNKRAHRRASAADGTFTERVAAINSKHGKCDTCRRTSARLEARPCKRLLKPKGKKARPKQVRCTGTIQVVDEPLKTKPPRRVELNGKATYVYSSGVLALMCGKAPATVRTWIEERVLPGFSISVSRRYWFTADFIDAVAEAVRKVLFVDGRGKLGTLRRYVRQELAARGIHYTPFSRKGD